MIREAVATGETVEIAFANACRELGVETTDAEFEILEMPTKKTFGLFGGSPAKVRAYIEENNPAQEAANYLKNVLREMGLPDVTVEIQEEEAGAALTLNGEDIGFIIGHRPGCGKLSGKAERNFGITGKKDGGQSGENRTKLFFRADESL